MRCLYVGQAVVGNDNTSQLLGGTIGLNYFPDSTKSPAALNVNPSLVHEYFSKCSRL